MSLRLRAETDQDGDSLREGRIDLWVGATTALDSEIRVQKLYSSYFLALADKDHPIFDGVPCLTGVIRQ